MKRTLLLSIFGTTILLLAACASSVATTNTLPPSPTELPPLPTLSPEQVALGEMVYANNCASCHGANLEGEKDWKKQNEDKSFRAPPHTAEGHTWHHPDSMLIEAIKLGGARYDGLNVGGTSNMPAFGDTLTDEEITAVLAFIKSTWPEETRAVQWQVTVQNSEQ